jgi:hypothetical protein
MRTPDGRFRKVLVRRVRSCHGSDCPLGPHKLRESRCLILTRVDYADGRPSEGWVSGDCQESSSRAARLQRVREYDSELEIQSERLQRQRHTFDPGKPLVYGGGFWEKVVIPALPALPKGGD